MRVGEQAQVVLKRVEEMTKELNDHVLPPDVKIVPYYDRSDLIEETTQTVEAQSASGDAAGADDPGAVSVQRTDGDHRRPYHSVRADVRVHLPRLASHSPRTCFRSARLISAFWWMARWSWWRIFSASWRAARSDYDVIEVIRAAAHDVERPIFYAAAVIIAGHLRSTRSGPVRAFVPPMSGTRLRLLGSVICALIVPPVICLLSASRPILGAEFSSSI